MDYKEYQKIVKKESTKNNKLRNAVISFFIGGGICLLGEIIANLLVMVFSISSKDAVIWMMIGVVFIAILFTGLGFFDKWVTFSKAGLIVPITGFAHSISSAMLDYKKDGLVPGIGSNTFKLAGSVILYGVVTAFLLVIVKVVLNG